MHLTVFSYLLYLPGGRVRAVSETEAMEVLAEERKDSAAQGTVRKRRWSQGNVCSTGNRGVGYVCVYLCPSVRWL